MKRYFKKYFVATLLFSSAPLLGSLSSSCCKIGVAPYYSIRSQSEDSARELVGWTNFVNLYDMQDRYGAVAFTPEYTQSFRDNRITRCLFGNSLQCNCDCPFIQISGSNVTDRKACDWLADYFGLAPDFQSKITFEPKVQNFLVDMNLYLGLDNWKQGLYFRIHAPLVHARWSLNYCECVCETGTQGYAEGYFTADEDGIPRENLLNNATQFFSKCRTPDLGTDICFNPLVCCKWSDCDCDPLTETRLSDIQVAVGWNFLQDESYHFGVNIRGSFPTGTRPSGLYLFEPVIGNGHHWEVGGGYTAHFLLWQSEDENSHFAFYSDGNFTHLFAARQCRCFDLCCPGENSRYMLAAKYGNPVVKNLAGEQETGDIRTYALAQFKSVYSPVACLTHQMVNVSIGVQADITAMFNYTRGGFTWDLGYNFWGKSCEKIRPRCDCATPLADGRTWGLKGDSRMFGFDGTNPENFVPLSATQTGVFGKNCATIHTGRNVLGPKVDVDGDPTANLSVDNAQDATGDSSDGNSNNDLFITRNEALLDRDHQIATSIQPQFLGNCDIDYAGAQTKGISHKIFTNFSYAWIDREYWIPYVGVGAKVEFGGPGSDCCRNVCADVCGTCDVTTCPTNCFAGCPTGCETTNCGNCCSGNCCDCRLTCCDPCDQCRGCQTCNLSEWGVWLKGGVAFQ